MPSPEQLLALETQIAPAAVASERLTGLPAELACAQCILESGWLTKMPSGTRNPFGIKSGGPKSGVLTTTHEWFTAAELQAFLARGDGRTAKIDPDFSAASMNKRKRYIVRDYFAAYASLAEAFTDHANLLLNREPYMGAVKRYQQDHDLAAAISIIAASYATDPHYAEQVTEIATSKPVVDIVAQLRRATTGY